MTVRLITGSAHNLSVLPAQLVHASMFSPPYFGLRSYHGDQSVNWPDVTYCPMPGMPSITVPVMSCPLGNEPTIEAYIGHMILVMREVWRVLRDDGTCWVNLGDTYSNSAASRPSSHRAGHEFDSRWQQQMSLDEIKEKDMMLVPARFALAAQADGWYVRNDIIWAKGVSFNPVYSGSTMPQSRTDAFTQSHEYVWLLAKGKRYWFDMHAVKEEPVSYTRKGGTASYTANGSATHGVGSKSLHQMSATGRTPRTVWTINPSGYKGAHFAPWPPKLVEPMILAATSARGVCPNCGAPWSRIVHTGESTYAKVKREDGLSWSDMQRIAEENGTALKAGALATGGTRGKNGAQPSLSPATAETLGWVPGCDCYDVVLPEALPDDPSLEEIDAYRRQLDCLSDLPTVPATVLDPFSGSGTTGAVATKLHRNYIGIDINAGYHDLAEERIGGTQPALFLE